ncbi:hypothetical protein D3C81_1864200 [compost metagenome]
MVEHLPRDVIGQRVLLMERRITQHSVIAERFHARQCVVDHKLAAIQRVWHVGFHVQAAGRHRHRRFIHKHHARLRVLLQQRQTHYAITATEIDNLTFQIVRQMFDKETCANIQPGTGEDVSVIVDRPVGAFQLPAQRL